jgi:hypothetical protein
VTPHEAWLRTQLIRTSRVLTAAQRRMPKVLAGLVGIALIIPGPQDEAVVAVLIVGWLLCMKRAKRSMILGEIREAWNVY